MGGGIGEKTNVGGLQNCFWTCSLQYFFFFLHIELKAAWDSERQRLNKRLRAEERESKWSLSLILQSIKNKESSFCRRTVEVIPKVELHYFSLFFILKKYSKCFYFFIFKGQLKKGKENQIYWKFSCLKSNFPPHFPHELQVALFCTSFSKCGPLCAAVLRRSRGRRRAGRRRDRREEEEEEIAVLCISRALPTTLLPLPSLSRRAEAEHL